MNNIKVKKLQAGETVISKKKGNSMMPLIKSKQPVMLAPANSHSVRVGDIVFCKVKGRFYTHLVKAKNDKKGCLIGNNKGGVNGWTKTIYGKVIEIMES